LPINPASLSTQKSGPLWGPGIDVFLMNPTPKSETTQVPLNGFEKSVLSQRCGPCLPTTITFALY